MFVSQHVLSELYRTRLPYGRPLRVGFGHLVRLPSVAGKEFSHYFRPIGFSARLREIRRQSRPTRATFQSADRKSVHLADEASRNSFRFLPFWKFFSG